MDMTKFYEHLVKDESIKDIPIIYVLRIAVVILEIIDSGECMHEIEHI